MNILGGTDVAVKLIMVVNIWCVIMKCLQVAYDLVLWRDFADIRVP
jgi:hypothetical protein